MKPLNLDNSPCAPQSSNCVIWQGPNISCIKLCTGDTISDVTYKLATELCTIMSELNLTNYDLSCLNLTTSEPTTFNELIQLLISKICELENIPTNTTPGTGGCPDCVVTVATCFQTGTQTTMQLLDYVTAIANKVCAILLQITTINASITALTLRVFNLENNQPPVPDIPEVSTTCIIGSVPINTLTPINIVLDQLINNTTNGYCSLLGATGSPAVITTAIGIQLGIVTGASPSYGTPGNKMIQSYPFWITSPGTISASITNMWYSIGDIRTALSSLLAVNVVADASPNSGIIIPAPVTVLGVKTFTISSKTTEIVAGSGVTVTPVVTGGLKTTYTISTDPIAAFGGLYTSGTPVSVNKISPILGTTNLLNDGIAQVPGIVYDDTSSYNTTSGIWTCPTTGRYNISFSIQLKSGSGASFSTGSMVAGLTDFNTKIYISNAMTTTQTVGFMNVNGTAIGVELTAGDFVLLRILNLTDIDYSAISTDTVSMSIQRIK